tara:strand:+ start:43 stop:327 length:285 start_codon:yes stop_codon:yes gene_type:complete
MNKKLQKILEDIYKMDSADIQSIVDAVKLRRNQLHLQDAQSFRVGDTVFFRGRRNTLCEAKVEKIKIKYVLVRTLDGTRWNVPGSHLSTEAVNA